MHPLDSSTVGKTDIKVTRLGLGAAALAGLYHAVTESGARGTIERALSLGIRLIDTAPLYGHGKSETYLGEALRGVPRSSYVLATKAGRLLVPAQPAELKGSEFDAPLPFKPVFDFSYDGVLRSVEESLIRLRLDRLDIVHIHDPDDHEAEALKGALPALDRLRGEGVIRAVGAGMNQTAMLARFARTSSFDCFLLAGRYTLLDQSGLIELLPLCERMRISVIIGGPFNSGILATGARPGAKFDYAEAPAEILDRVRKLEQVCARYAVPLKAAALQFPLAHPAVASIIPGARSATETEENFHLLLYPIPGGFWEELKRERLIPDSAPTP